MTALKLFHVSRPTTVLSVALLAATAVIGSTINTTSYLDSISASLPVATTRQIALEHQTIVRNFVLPGFSASATPGSVLGDSVTAPLLNTADASSTIAALVTSQMKQYLAQGLLTGPAGPQGLAGSSAVVSNGNGQTTSLIGGIPIVTYVPANPSNNFTGGSIAGFTNLSSANFTSQAATIQAALTVSGSATIAGAASIGGTLSTTGIASFASGISIGSSLSSVAPLYVSENTASSIVGTLSATNKFGLHSIVRGNYVYGFTGSGSSFALIVSDISDPAHPVQISTTQPNIPSGEPGNPTGLVLSGPYAFVIDDSGDGNVTAFNISNPKSPSFINQFSTSSDFGANGSNFPYTIAASGRYLYVGGGNDANAKVAIIDVSDPLHPLYDGVVAGSGYIYSSAVSGRYLYYVDGNNFRVADMNNASSPVEVGSLAESGAWNYGGRLIAVSGKYAYVVGNGTNTFYIIDISNPASPTLTGSASLSSLPSSIVVLGIRAYIATASGILDYNVSNPSSPSLIGTLDSNATSYSTEISVNGRALVADNGDVVSLGGGYIQQLEAGGITAGSLNLQQSASIGNALNVSGGITVGSAGIYSAGPVGIYSVGGGSNVLSVVAASSTMSTGKTASFDDLYAANYATSSTASITKTGIRISSTGAWSGTSSRNIGLYISSVTGGTNNYDAIFNGGGNVGIGTTSPTYLLYVGSASVASGTVAQFQNANGTCGINPTLNTLTCSSDERLKKNITPYDGDSLAQVMALQPVYFNWNAESSGTPEHPGFIAQQVQQVMPEVVSADPNTGLLSIGYSDLVPAMVSAMQQMQAEITTLQGGLNGNASSSNLTVYSPANFSGDSVGEAQITAGQTSVRVTFSQAYAHEPIVTAFPEGAFEPGFIAEKDSSGFTLAIPSATTTSVTFDWHSFSSPAEQLTVSDGSTAPIVLIAPSAPVPVVIPFSIVSPDSSTSASSTVDSSASSTPSVPDTSTSTPSVGPPPISIAPTPSPDVSTGSPATTDTPAASGGQ